MSSTRDAHSTTSVAARGILGRLQSIVISCVNNRNRLIIGAEHDRQIGKITFHPPNAQSSSVIILPHITTDLLTCVRDACSMPPSAHTPRSLPSAAQERHLSAPAIRSPFAGTFLRCSQVDDVPKSRDCFPALLPYDIHCGPMRICPFMRTVF